MKDETSSRRLKPLFVFLRMALACLFLVSAFSKLFEFGPFLDFMVQIDLGFQTIGAILILQFVIGLMLLWDTTAVLGAAYVTVNMGVAAIIYALETGFVPWMAIFIAFVALLTLLAGRENYRGST